MVLYESNFSCDNVLSYPTSPGANVWVWLALIVLVIVVIALFVFYFSTPSSKPNNTMTTANRLSAGMPRTLAAARPGAARNSMSTIAKRQSTVNGGKSSAVVPHVAKVVKKAAETEGLSVLANMTLTIPSLGSQTPFAVAPMVSSTTGMGCTQYTATSGPNANQSQSITTPGNTLEQQAWNNVDSSYLTGTSPPKPPTLQLLSDVNSYIQFEQCKNGNTTPSSGMGISSSSPVAVSFGYPTGSNYSVITYTCPQSVSIFPDAFMLRLFYAPSQNTSYRITSATATLTGEYEGKLYKSTQAVSLFSGSSMQPFQVLSYIPVPTIIATVDDGSTCISITDVTNPQVLFNVTLSSGKTLSQKIDIVQRVYAVPPVGTWIFDDSTTFFNNGGNPQNVIWLNDAINFYTLPQTLMATGPRQKIHVVPPVVPQTVPLYTSRDAFSAWKLRYAKSYGVGATEADAAEDAARYTIFQNNVSRAAQLNVNQPNARYGATKFADLTKEELIKNYTGLSIPANPAKGSGKLPKRVVQAIASSKSSTPPAQFDWREKGAVTPVKNQEGCGSCWAFSSTGAIEGQWFLKTGKLISLSEQQLVDCAVSNGCNGSWMGTAFDYVINLAGQGGGMMTEEAYPYTATSGSCQYTAPPSGTTYPSIQSWAFLPEENGYVPEDDLAHYLYTIGPLSTMIDVGDLGLYIDGVADPQNCNANPSHCVLIVGYGVQCTTPYWIIKNSWGTDYGNDGYLYLKRQIGSTGSAVCGINANVPAAFYEGAPGYYSGSLQIKLPSGATGTLINLIDETATGCTTVTVTTGGATASPTTLSSANYLSAQDWVNSSTTGNGPSSPKWVAPVVTPIKSSTATVVFGSCNANVSSSCSSSSLPSVSVTTTSSTPSAYVIGTQLTGGSKTCQTFSIPLQNQLTVALNTCQVRLVVIPDGSQPTVTLNNAGIELVGQIYGTSTSTGMKTIVSSTLQNYTPTNYLPLSLLFTNNQTYPSDVSFQINTYFSNGVSLSVVSQPLSQELFLVPPVSTIILTPIFASNTMDIVVLNDAVNAYQYN